MGPPVPRRLARWPFIALGIVSACGLSAGLGWSAGVSTSWDAWVAAEREAVVAQDQLDQCLDAEGRVTTSAIHAGVEVIRMQRYLEQARAYADAMQAPVGELMVEGGR